MLRTDDPSREVRKVRREVGPGGAVVPGKLNQAVIRAYPDQALLEGRLCDGVDHPGVFHPDVVRE